MNKLYKFLIISLAAGTLVSCQKDYHPIEVPEDQKNQINNIQGHFKCNMNGHQFSSEFQQAYITVVEGSGTRTLTINGTKFGDTRLPEDSQSITINISMYEGPKWYTVSYPASATYTFAQKDYPTNIYATSGSDEEQYVEITSDDGKYIKGKFRVKLTNTAFGASEDKVDLTEGEFEAPIMNR